MMATNQRLHLWPTIPAKSSATQTMELLQDENFLLDVFTATFIIIMPNLGTSETRGSGSILQNNLLWKQPCHFKALVSLIMICLMFPKIFVSYSYIC